MAEFIFALADASTIWLTILSMIMCIIPLAIVGGMVYGMNKLLKALPPAFDKAQKTMASVSEGADKATSKVASPFITASARAAQVQASLRTMIRVIRREA